MNAQERIVALIVAAGKGERAGGAFPKQFQLLAGEPVLAHSVRACARHPAIDDVIVVVAPGQEERARAVAGDHVLIAGGPTRRASVMNGLMAIGSAGRVLIHDAARPLLPAMVIDRLLGALDRADGSVPVLPVVDTLMRAEKIVPRDGLVRVQTPQAFRFDAVMTAHARWPAHIDATDDAQMVRAAGFEVVTVEGDPALEKITNPGDLMAAESRSGARASTRSATGYDVHRLAVGEPLWLGGVSIPHEMGLVGHSDADVALHALTDALLGTIGAGDIGQHFPPSDPQWRGASSDRFLTHAAMLIARAGGRIEHVDLTIICEAPRIGPHRETIRARIADLLQLDRTAVSVKATTTEGLGFTGRSEGIAAHAIATVTLFTAL